MKGQPASHGQTKTHRKMGATGGGGVSIYGNIMHAQSLPEKFGAWAKFALESLVFRSCCGILRLGNRGHAFPWKNV